MPDRRIDVEVAWATPERQLIVPVVVPLGTTAVEAVRLSGIEQEAGEKDLAERPLGVFGKRVKPGHVLAEGDRVEIYRPLKADPKIVRRELAAMGKTMGGGKARRKETARNAGDEAPGDG
jgi:putative ubiquitin-RnfH superfamily antitoxin RatB of RatAB toxin-antitoxin module